MSYRFVDNLFANCQQNLYVLLCVQSKTPDDGQRNCPKRVESYSKNKVEILVYLVGFIIRIYYDARSSECQNMLCYFFYVAKILQWVILKSTHILLRGVL